VSRFAEALDIIVPLLRDGHVDFAGDYYEVRDCVLTPRGPSRKGPPIIIGSKGPRMMRLTAHYANGYNSVWHRTPDVVVSRYAELRTACEQEGRDFNELQRSAGTMVHMLAPGETLPADSRAITGSPEEVAEQLRAFERAGVQELIVILDPDGLDGIERFVPVVELLDRQH